ncbi:MAG: amidophosphoribosyltransferase [Sulfuricurvum sp. GWF2_44_89]|uniref:Amidophosphoribosyltransferase n=1 Tax=Sulfuricurvum kujiense TaxID=148813 RepID=A0A2D3W9X8_9BACT|nr:MULTISPECIES: amidophosphoribosyltransferase [Sulfuricurvum]OHD77140.1 MAG: amidophosphoribosyltransferase [Sulfuricurvum sp. GWF2_44_89]OHD95544.1 MAG: amidophosphoribosyltransferase [Sulfuricurvum sp. RIFOXYD12_FULL_44_77]OHE00130.1 MAG: amidophosphoribosyltransferase [Sulfuricurvum sp. RIFOXYD2_FULL_44_160]DAB38132.1 MAG TPA: amidophosphoribosyltransferase [Sulfuricurvum kujiense]
MRSLNEKCAVVGIFDHPEASKLAYFSLHALQHRGQEAAGISTSDGEKLYTIKDRGLVTQVFDPQKLNTLKGHMAIGHTRYSTAGDDSILDAQPVFARYDLGEMSIVHNGNLTNAKEVRDALIKKGAIFQTFMDTENLIHLIAKSDQHHLTDRIIDAVKKIEGAYSLVFLSRSKMFAMRDPHGFRPLSLGRVGDGYVVASETCAFDLIGAEYIRDVEPGELLIFEKGKAPQSIKVFEPTPKHCIFEYVYFARPDSNVYNQNVYEMRKAMGKALAKEQPVVADMVVPVPDGGVPAAIGYSQASGIPFEMAIMRNHYIGRTFIEPTQEMRDLKVKMKLSPINDLIRGKRLIVIDDSIVRGTTSRQIVRMLKAAGAAEVHMRISSPPTTDPCYYGVDTPDKEKLIASNMTNAEICAFIEADSLGYLSNEALLASVNGKEENYCTACFTGKYII